MTLTQEYVDYPTERGWWWYTDGQSITPMFVDPDKNLIVEQVGTDKQTKITSLKGKWQKTIRPGNSKITISEVF